MSGPRSRFTPTLLLLGGAAAVTAVVLTALVALEWSPLLTLDRRIVDAAHRQVLAHDWLLTTARAVTHLGDPLVVWLVSTALAVGLWLRGARRAALAIIGIRLAAVVVTAALKTIVGRARPHFEPAVAHAAGASFPSGHALGSAALFGTIAVLLWRRGQGRLVVLAAAVVAPVLVAASRVLLGVHWPSDVVAGLCLGWLAAATFLALVPPDSPHPP